MLCINGAYTKLQLKQAVISSCLLSFSVSLQFLDAEILESLEETHCLSSNIIFSFSQISIKTPIPIKMKFSYILNAVKNKNKHSLVAKTKY